MLVQIPRKPVFPQHIIKKEIARVENDVQNEVIPVSAGIYSQYKLNQRLQAIPKPVLADYEDPIFYQLADIAKKPCRSTTCPLCGQSYGNKHHKATQCKFCGVWNCSHCICPRKRYHPRAKESNSQLYDICYNCDDKFLNLIMNHAYVERKTLWEQAIKRVRQERDQIATEVDQIEDQKGSANTKIQKNKFKISALKKEIIDNSKFINKLKDEKHELLKRGEERQGYLKELMEKKKKKDQQKRRIDPSERQVISKPVRTLSHKNVISESVFHQNVQLNKPQIQQTQSKNEKQSQSQVHHPEAHHRFQAKPIEIKKQPAQNFFNYHEWGRQQQEQAGVFKANAQQQPETKLNQSLEEQPIIGSLSHSQNIQQESAEHLQSLVHQKLAQIFAKPERNIVYDEDLLQTSSLESQALEEQKKAIVRAAIQCHQNLETFVDEVQSQVQPQKCACVIY